MAEPATVPQGVRPAWWRVLTVPCWGALFPRQAGRVLRNAPWWMVLLNYAGIIVVISVTILALMLWSEMRREVIRPIVSPLPSFVGLQPISYELQQRTLSEVWAEWQSVDGYGPVESTTFWVTVIVLSCSALLTWLHVSTLSPLRRVSRALGTGWRLVPAGGGMLAIFVLAFGTMIVAGNLAEEQIRGDEDFGMTLADPRFYVLFLAPAGLGLLLARIGSVFWSVAASQDTEDESPLCEGCGYDLTHRPTDGRCTECGTNIDESLSPGLRRPGSAWQQNPSLFAFLKTSFQMLALGSKAHRSLLARKPDRAMLLFAEIHYALIGLAAATWALACFVITEENNPGEILIAVPLAVMSVVPLFGWLTHRFVGAVVTSWWMLQGMLNRPHVVSVVHHGETAFLWMFCLCNGVLITSYVLFEDWLREEFGRSLWILFGMPPEPAALLMGSGVLILVWLRRYHRGLLAVRWANF